MQKKLHITKIFSIIVPTIYLIVNIYGVTCGDRLGVWNECMGSLALIQEATYKLNPLYWVVLFLSTMPESGLLIFIGTVLLLLSYIFGIYWFYLLGRLLDATIYKIYYLNKKYLP